MPTSAEPRHPATAMPSSSAPVHSTRPPSLMRFRPTGNAAIHVASPAAASTSQAMPCPSSSPCTYLTGCRLTAPGREPRSAGEEGGRS